jgi:hypothetical protein
MWKGVAIRGWIRKRMGKFRITIRQRGCKLRIPRRQLKYSRTDGNELSRLLFEEVFKRLAGVVRP